MIQVILFDFYGVFVADAYNDWLARNGLQREGEFARLIDERDRGTLNEPDFLYGLSQAAGQPVTQADIHNQSVAPLSSELVQLVQKLKPHYRIGLLSNASVNLRSKLTNLGIVELFDEVIISSEIGHAKPSSQAFKTAIDRLGVTDASDIVFIDDNSVNVRAAARSGMIGVHFTTPSDLYLHLQAAGVNIN